MQARRVQLLLAGAAQTQSHPVILISDGHYYCEMMMWCLTCVDEQFCWPPESCDLDPWSRLKPKQEDRKTKKKTTSLLVARLRECVVMGVVVGVVRDVVGVGVSVSVSVGVGVSVVVVKTRVACDVSPIKIV